MSSQSADVVGGDEGCGRPQTSNASRLNALRHGLTAKTPVLPGEDPAALQAKIDAYKADYETRNEIENDLAEMAAMAFWRAKRANRLGVWKVTRDIVTRPQADAVRAGLDVRGLGKRLFFDRRGPWQLYPSGDGYENGEPRTSASKEAEDPQDPDKIVFQLSATRDGRRWLLERWGELREPIASESESGWISCQKFRCVRLLGKQPLDAVFDKEVALVFLASHAVSPNYDDAFHELRCEIHEKQVENTMAELHRGELEAITPADEAAGRAALLAIVDKAVERLRRLEAEQGEVADFAEEIDAEIPSDQGMKTAEQVDRHVGSCNRLMIRNLDAIDKARRNEVDGWGKLRELRERKKQEARHRKATLDSPLVLDEHGTVREAFAYDGNVEEGLARYKAVMGRQLCEYRMAEARDIDQGSKHVIPDFARWVAGERGPGSGGTRMEPHGGGTDGRGGMDARVGFDVNDANLEKGPTDVGQMCKVVPSALGQQQALGIDGGRGAERHGECSEPERRNEDGVERGSEGFLVREASDQDSGELIASSSLLLTAKEEEANIQNEINALSVMLDGGEGGSPNEVGAEGKCGRAEGGDALGAPGSRRTGEEDGGGEGKNFGDGDGGDPSGARDRRGTRTGQDDGGGEEETFGQGDGGVRDPRRTGANFGDGDGGDPSGARDRRGTRTGQDDGGGEEETFGQGDGGVRDPRRTGAHADGGEPSGARDPHQTVASVESGTYALGSTQEQAITFPNSRPSLHEGTCLRGVKDDNSIRPAPA